MIVVGLNPFVQSYAQAQCAARTAEEQHNLERMLDFYNNVLIPLKTERFKDYVAPTFIEHYPGMNGSLAALKELFDGMKKDHPNGLPPSKPVLAMVDGDLVTLVVVRETVKDPKDPSKNHQLLGFETMRVKDGKQVEHWEEHMALPKATGGN